MIRLMIIESEFVVNNIVTTLSSFHNCSKNKFIFAKRHCFFFSRKIIRRSLTFGIVCIW